MARDSMDPEVGARFSGAPDDMQDLGLRKLPEGAVGLVQGAARNRYLSLGALRVHKRHVQNAKAEGGKTRCRCGAEGLAGFFASLETRRRRADELVQGGGADEEADAASSPDRGASAWPN